MENNIKVFYLRDKRNNPVACVATVKGDGTNQGCIFFAVSMYNPKDKFSKNIGKQIAIGRLSRISEESLHKFGTLYGEENVKQRIVKYIQETKIWDYDAEILVPAFSTRTREAAKLWLKRHNQLIGGK